MAYRSGFFDLRRLVDFGAWPGGGVFVDDDWISSVLDSARVPRVVLGLTGSELADQIRNQPLVAPQSELEGLNSEAGARVRLQSRSCCPRRELEDGFRRPGTAASIQLERMTAGLSR